MLADAASKYGVEFALSDLFTFGSEKASAACGRIRSSGCALPASATCERTRSSTRRSLRIRTASSARARLRPERSRLVLIDARVLKRRRGKSAMVDFAAPDRHATAFAGL
jgi:hypothetical protein